MSRSMLVRMTKRKVAQIVDIIGDPGRNRTCDQQLRRLLVGDVTDGRLVLDGRRHKRFAQPQLHPVVLPHVSHFKHVPFRTNVKFPHSPHASPS
jgi:hypothetical protein